MLTIANLVADLQALLRTLGGSIFDLYQLEETSLRCLPFLGSVFTEMKLLPEMNWNMEKGATLFKTKEREVSVPIVPLVFQ